MCILLLVFYAAAPRDIAKERGPSRPKKAPWWVVPKEVGAPARGIRVAPGATALTPRDTGLSPVLGLGIHPPGFPYRNG